MVRTRRNAAERSAALRNGTGGMMRKVAKVVAALGVAAGWQSMTGSDVETIQHVSGYKPKFRASSLSLSPGPVTPISWFEFSSGRVT